MIILSFESGSISIYTENGNSIVSTIEVTGLQSDAVNDLSPVGNPFNFRVCIKRQKYNKGSQVDYFLNWVNPKNLYLNGVDLAGYDPDEARDYFMQWFQNAIASGGGGGGSVSFNDLTDKPDTIRGYNITDGATLFETVSEQIAMFGAPSGDITISAPGDYGNYVIAPSGGPWTIRFASADRWFNQDTTRGVVFGFKCKSPNFPLTLVAAEDEGFDDMNTLIVPDGSYVRFIALPTGGFMVIS